MKKLFLSTLLSFFVYFLIGQSSPFSVQEVSKEVNHTRSISLPFFEDWSSASLETNNWTTECENWVINYQEGNENPSVEFSWDPWFQSEYSCALVSDIFNGDVLEVGQIMLDFDIRLDNRQATGDEKLLVEVFDGTDWNIIAEFSNTGNIDWQSNSIDISDYTLGHTFQIRFNATGQNSFHILSWFVDNISIYRICEAAVNLSGEQIWGIEGEWVAIVELGWEPPPSTVVDKFAWKHWDTGENDGGVGTTSGGIITVAAQWDSTQLFVYSGDTIETIRFFLNDNGFSDIVVKVWTGKEAENLIYTDTVDSPIPDSWNEHILDSILLINPDTHYRIGYTIIEQVAGFFPAGKDFGPAKPGYGDLIKIGDDEWERISDFGIDNNFNIQMKLLNSDSSVRSCTGFNIYRKMIFDDPDYYFKDFVPFVKDKNSYSLNDTGYWHFDTPCYKVSTVWSDEGDTCISDFAKDMFEMGDHVCILLWEGINQNENKHLSIYPNPTSQQLNIITKDGTAIEEVSIYNLTGQKVFQGKLQNNVLDISKLQTGMYVVEVVIGQRKIRQKIIVR